jgi:hypothetical protein
MLDIYYGRKIYREFKKNDEKDESKKEEKNRKRDEK